MFMQQNKPTPEEKAQQRRKTWNGFASFFFTVIAIRVAPFVIEYSSKFSK
ncbi:13380_t:CDS:2 [Funneliformis mosseae]|uniref:13380_t:CDS:1 n=1 Tax=Funneliformis mosseae TaxID=27381 RepID=A0A9N9F1B5_FUNMO|nr:13380_t:CDS:2 [Funneliformis mosseae]